jgi:hypothetical protein
MENEFSIFLENFLENENAPQKIVFSWKTIRPLIVIPERGLAPLALLPTG